MPIIKKKNINDILDIDWNGVIRTKVQPNSKEAEIRYWDKRAASFVDHAGKSAYPKEFLKIMKPQRSWTVLDMGCGGGTLSLPLAPRVKNITAVDISPEMLGMLEKQAQKESIKNIRTLRAAWEDDWGKKSLGKYDVAVASRSLSTDDFEAAIRKLDRAAVKRVYISTVAGDGPRDRRIFEAIGREFKPFVDYIYIYNLLYQMGIHANLHFIDIEKRKTFNNLEDAKKYLMHKIGDISPVEEKGLEKFILENVISEHNKSAIEYKKSYKWAVMWWVKDKQES